MIYKVFYKMHQEIKQKQSMNSGCSLTVNSDIIDYYDKLYIPLSTY